VNDMGDDDKSIRKDKLYIVVLVIIIVALWLIIPNIPGLIEVEEENDGPPPQKYEKIQSEDIIVYENLDLNVNITRIQIEGRETPTYEAHWTNATGDFKSVVASSSDKLFNEILQVEEDLTSNQLIWFDYMLEKVVK
jgi:hypothetical protein